MFYHDWDWLTDWLTDYGRTDGTSSILRQALCIISNPSVNSNWSYNPETLNSGQNWCIFVPHDLETWRMTSKNDSAPHLYYIKLCVSFQSHGWIQAGVTVRKRTIQFKIDNFLSCVTLKFEEWPWKTIEHLFYTALLQFEFTNGYEMMHKARSSMGEVSYWFSRSSVKCQGHTGQKIADFDPNWAFPDCNSSLNSHVALKWCTKLEVA